MTINLEIGNQKNKDGTVSLYFRITLNRKSKRIESGYRVNKKYWKKKAGQKRYYLTKLCPDFVSIEKSRLELEGKLLALAKTKRYLDVSGLVEELKKPLKIVKTDSGFFGYAVEHIEKLRLENAVGYSKTILSGVKDFYCFIFNTEIKTTVLKKGEFVNDIKFEEISLKLLNDFEHFLKVKGLKTNTVYTKFKVLKTIYNKAEKEDQFLSVSNPFKRKTLRLAKTKKKALDLSDIIKMEKVELHDHLLNEARNMFLMSFYCGGLRWGDVCTLKWENIEGNVLTVTPRKTINSNASEKLIPLKEKALKILEESRFGKKASPDDFIFSIIGQNNNSSLFNQISSKNALVNRRLKKVATSAQVNVLISFHMARHSFATLALQSDVSFAEISQLLGHSDFKTTQMYLKELSNQRIFAAHAKILDY